MKYRFLPHRADYKIKVYGANLKEIIENSLLALKEFLKPKLTKQKIEKEIEVEGKKIDLLINFLSEILAETYIKKVVFLKFKGEIEENKIKGKIVGFRFKNLIKDIKAITYHQAKLTKQKNGLIFEFIIDV